MACYRDSPAVPGFSMAIERLRFSTSYERSTESNLRSIQPSEQGFPPCRCHPSVAPIQSTPRESRRTVSTPSSSPRTVPARRDT